MANSKWQMAKEGIQRRDAEGAEGRREGKFRFAPFPYFGGKRTIAAEVWARLGSPKQYIEPFCGSAAVLLAAPAPAHLEVIGDINYYIANFWRAVKFQPEATYRWTDYPVSHVDLDARHRWLTHPDLTEKLKQNLQDPEWPGSAQMAGWWVWGQCCWIGSGWCEKPQIPHAGNAGRGVQSQIPHASDAGMGVQSKIPHASDAGRGVRDWFLHLAQRLERCRVVHGSWDRMLNHHYGGDKTAIFFDPPYRSYERLYHNSTKPFVALEVEAWCRENAGLRIALCGLVGDYSSLSGWKVLKWSRGKFTYGGKKTTKEEAIWFSPACEGGRA
jgi:hypothetical protein